MNFLPAQATWPNGSLEVVHEGLHVRTAHGAGADLREAAPDGSACWIGIRPEDVHLTAPAEGLLQATVYVTEPLGGETVVDVQLGGRVIKALSAPNIA